MSEIKLAFAALMQSGKDSAVDYCISKAGGKRLKFADKLYDCMYAVQNVLNLPAEKDRKFLQIVGTEWGRAKDPDIWVNAFVASDMATEGNRYCSDARFKNEFKKLKELGYVVILIRRPRSERWKSELNRINASLSSEHYGVMKYSYLWLKMVWKFWRSLHHASEKDVKTYKDFDAIIDNDGTLEEFYEKLDHLLSIVKYRVEFQETSEKLNDLLEKAAAK